MDGGREIDVVKAQFLSDPVHSSRVHLLQGEGIEITERLAFLQDLQGPADIGAVGDIESDDAEKTGGRDLGGGGPARGVIADVPRR